MALYFNDPDDVNKQELKCTEGNRIAPGGVEFAAKIVRKTHFIF